MRTRGSVETDQGKQTRGVHFEYSRVLERIPMDDLFFHPKLVHLPVALALVMPFFAAGLSWAWWRDWLPARGWVLAIAMQATLFGSGLMAIQSGEAQEERVESVVPERFIEEHAEAAEAFVWASGIVLCLMLLALVLAGRGAAGLALATISTIGTLVVFVLGYRTGDVGGALVYQHGAASVYAQPAAQAPPTPWGQMAEDDEADEYDEDDD